MKFGKLLQTTAADMPEMNQLFLRYKQLKKQLKGLPNQPDLPAADGASAGPSAAAACVATGTSQHAVGNAIPQPVAAEGPAGAGVDGCSSSGRLSPEEQHFIQTLNEDLARFNDFFMEREEEAVIKLQSLVDQLHAVDSEAGLAALKQAFVDFHGEMVLLLHWSLLNYAGLVKILKKHDKRTGLLLRAPYLANVLEQPFTSTSLMSRMARQAEEHVKALVGATLESLPRRSPPQPAERTADEGTIFRRAKIALETWQTLKKTAATPSTVAVSPAPHARPPAASPLRTTPLPPTFADAEKASAEGLKRASDDEVSPGSAKRPCL